MMSWEKLLGWTHSNVTSVKEFSCVQTKYSPFLKKYKGLCQGGYAAFLSSKRRTYYSGNPVWDRDTSTHENLMVIQVIMVITSYIWFSMLYVSNVWRKLTWLKSPNATVFPWNKYTLLYHTSIHMSSALCLQMAFQSIKWIVKRKKT